MGKPIQDGDIYKVVVIEGQKFEIRYGNITEAEKEQWEPIPVYPDFLRLPQYTDTGYPFATAYQDICECYVPKRKVSSEHWCDDCVWFDKKEEYIGICKCDKKVK